MDQTPLIVPITELRLDAASVVRQAASSGTPVYVTQRGRLTAVLLARPVFERLRREHEILCRVLPGELGVELGPGATLERVLRDGERALEKERPAEARDLATEARRQEDRERKLPEPRPSCTVEEFLLEEGYVSPWTE
jgi:prevent-host-death family protein